METAEKVINDVLRNSGVLSQPVVADSPKKDKDKEKEKSLKSKEVWDNHCMGKNLWTSDHHTHLFVLPQNCCHKVGTTQLFRMSLYFAALQISFTRIMGPKPVPALTLPLCKKQGL